MLIIKQDQQRLDEMEKQVNILDHMLTQHIISQEEFDYEIGELKVEYREIHRRNRELNEPKEEQSKTSDIDCNDMFDCSNQQTDKMFDSNVHQMIEEIENECRNSSAR